MTSPRGQEDTTSSQGRERSDVLRFEHVAARKEQRLPNAQLHGVEFCGLLPALYQHFAVVGSSGVSVYRLHEDGDSKDGTLEDISDSEDELTGFVDLTYPESDSSNAWDDEFGSKTGSHIPIQSGSSVQDTTSSTLSNVAAMPTERLVYSTSTTKKVVAQTSTMKKNRLELVQHYLDVNVDDSSSIEKFYTVAWAMNRSNEVLLVIGGDSAIVKVLCLSTPDIAMLCGHGAGINSLATHPTKMHLVLSASSDNSVRLWDVDTLMCLAIFCGPSVHDQQLLSVAWHPIGNCFASAGMDTTVAVWNMEDPEIQRVVAVSEALGELNVAPALALEKERRLSSINSGMGSTTTIWQSVFTDMRELIREDISTPLASFFDNQQDLELIDQLVSGKLVPKLLELGLDEENAQRIEGLCFERVCGACEDARKRFKPSLQQDALYRTNLAHGNYIDSISWVGDALLTKSTSERISLWMPDSLRYKDATVVLQEYYPPSTDLWSLKMAVSPQNSIFATGTSCGKVAIFPIGDRIPSHDQQPPSPERPLQEYFRNKNACPPLAILECGSKDDVIRQVSFSADNRYLVSCSDECVIRVWSVSSLKV